MPGPVIPKRPNPFMEMLPESVRGLVEAIFPSDELAIDSIAPVMTAGSGAIRGLRSMLPMDEASRMARAKDMGFTEPMYHGTRSRGDFSEFQGPVTTVSQHSNVKFPMMSGDYGIHVSPRPETAAKFTGETEYPGFMSGGGRIMPLLINRQKTLTMPDVKQWNSPYHWADALSLTGAERNAAGGFDPFLNPGYAARSGDPEMLGNLYEIAQRAQAKMRGGARGLDDSIRFQQDVTDLLTKGGYDSIGYRNLIEGVGEPSYLLLDPRRIRSRFADFDPAKFGSRDIMAGLAGAGVAGTLAGTRERR